MRRIAILILIMAAGIARAGDLVIPETLTITNIRAEAVKDLSRTVYAGQTLVLTNCVLCSDVAGAVRQGLSNVTVVVSVGIPGQYNVGTGVVQVATSGTWSATLTIPRGLTANPGYLNTKIVDALTNTLIYPQKQVTIKESF